MSSKHKFDVLCIRDQIDLSDLAVSELRNIWRDCRSTATTLQVAKDTYIAIVREYTSLNIFTDDELLEIVT